MMRYPINATGCIPDQYAAKNVPPYKRIAVLSAINRSLFGSEVHWEGNNLYEER